MTKTKNVKTARAKAPRANRLRRLAIWIAVVLAYATILWFWVFPWIDRTYVNRPALG
jgi:hypothetical protein